jgi:hypothetical protein
MRFLAGCLPGSAIRRSTPYGRRGRPISGHAALFEAQPGDEGIGRILERIVGRNGYEGATPTEIANWLCGAAKIGASLDFHGPKLT